MRDDATQAGPMYLWEHVEAMPYALNVLKSLHPHYRIGLASNAAVSTEIEIRAALQRVGLDTYIDVIFCRHALGHSKLAPEFWQAISTLSHVAAANILMIGDDYEKDVQAPTIAGLQSIWFNWRNQAKKNCPSITSLQQLPERLGCDLLES